MSSLAVPCPSASLANVCRLCVNLLNNWHVDYYFFLLEVPSSNLRTPPD